MAASEENLDSASMAGGERSGGEDDQGNRGNIAKRQKEGLTLDANNGQLESVIEHNREILAKFERGGHKLSREVH